MAEENRGALNIVKQTAETIKATVEAIQAVGNILNDAERSVVLELNNTSTRTLILQEVNSEHGGFRTPQPPHSLNPLSTALFAHASEGFLTGSEGWVKYRIDDEGTIFRLQWVNPFIGENESSCRVEGTHADWYVTHSFTGGGNKAAHQRFLLGELAEAAPRQSDWRTCGNCKLLFFALDEGHCQARPLGAVSAPSDFILHAAHGHLEGHPAGDPVHVAHGHPEGHLPRVDPTSGQPIFGKHEAAGHTFQLRHSVPGPNRETPWCKCGHCKALFFNGFEMKGVCPGRQGGHVAEAGSPDFHLAFDTSSRPAQQNDWRFCDKCFGLFFLPHNADSVCPAGGNHHAHHFNYVLDIA